MRLALREARRTERQTRCWQAVGSRVWTLPSTADKQVELTALATRAEAKGWLHMLYEGGATLARAWLEPRLVGELQLLVTSSTLGARRDSAFGECRYSLASTPR
jgi:riboflavin biosynthesis pyrimidine reductase